MSERMTMQMVTASVLGSLLFFTVSFAEEEKTVGQEVEVFDEASNKLIKYCDSTMTESCDCRKGLTDNPENAVPANECVLLNIGLGRARYSALTESIMLQLNELAPNSSLYSPSGFKVVAGYAVYGVSREKNTSNVPKHVQITDPSGVITRFLFADGESVAAPFAAIGNRTDGRLAMVDAEGWATAADPAYYDFYPGDGSLWRFGASQASTDYLRFVFHQTPQGRVETPQDMGVEIIRDADGVLRQVLTPAWLADFVVTGQDGYDLRLYPHDASCVPGTRSADGTYVIAQGVAPDAVWAFRNPQPGVPRELSVTRKRGDVFETWLYRYEEAVQDFTLVYPQGVMVKRLEREYSDDKKSWTLKRTLTASDGKVVRAEQKHFVNGVSGSLLTESVRDPDGLNLVKRYDYYQDPVLNRLLKAFVNEDGSWSRYEYDGQRRKTAEIRPWLDTPTNAPNNQCAVTRYSYTLFATGDFLAYNDQRPRTVVKEICGIEVSRTYHAYPTNALDQAQEIEERAAFPGAPYGHVLNPRTVKTYYSASAALPLPGRLATVAYPGRKTESYGYEYGTYNASTFVFTADPDGGAWRETVTTSYGAGSGVQALRSARVWDEKGREVLDESYVADGASFAMIGWKRLSYDRGGKLTETAYSDGRVESAAWGANCCGKESETSAEGIVTVYGYNALKQKVSESKKGLAADGSDDITTLYTYDLEGRVLSTSVTNIASGLGYVAVRNAYDTVGRLVNSFDSLGNATVVSYLGTGNRQVAPNGVTTVTERSLDGRTSRILENGVVKQSYASGVNPDGTQWITVYTGSAGTDSPVWSRTTKDFLGRTLSQEKPGFGGTVIAVSNAYDTTGNLLRVERRVSGAESRLLDATLYAYDAAGNSVLTALDVNGNGVIDLDGPDRVSSNDVRYVQLDGDWWRESRSFIYPDSATARLADTIRRRFTGLGTASAQGVLTAESVSADLLGNETSSKTYVLAAARKVTQFRVLPASTLPAVQVSVNGQSSFTANETGVTNTFTYDALGRQILSETLSGSTDDRRVALSTHYNALGQVDYTEDAAANRTSYTYDGLGRSVAVTDVLGNTTHTAYNAEGHVIATWGATYPVAYEYDTAGRMIALATSRDPAFDFSALTNSSLLTPNSSLDVTRWLYDQPTGLLTNKLYADGKGTAYTYTSDGKLATRTWARGVTTVYDYDSTGSLTNIGYSDSTPCVSFTYDRLDRQTVAQTFLSATGEIVSSTTNVYSEIDLVVANQVLGNSLFTLHEKFDAVGRAAGYALSNDVALITGTMQSYDTVGRLNQVAVNSIDGAFTFGYLEGSHLQKTLAMPNGVTRTFGYEPNRDLLNLIVHSNATDRLVQRDFTYDGIGRLENRTLFRANETPVSPDAFGYNLRSELTNAFINANEFAYNFDPIGNRTAATEFGTNTSYTANVLNQYTSISNFAAFATSREIIPEFDLDGNQTLLRTATGIWHVTYNAENRPVIFSNGIAVVSIAYDYMGRRFEYKETVNNTLTRHERYLYRGYLQIAALDMLNSSSVKHTLTWDPTEEEATRPLALQIGANVYFYSFDQAKNVTELFDSSSALTATYDYSPFGQVVTATGHISNPLTFSSEIHDSTLGLLFYNYRHLNMLEGRWVNRDPIEENGGVNLYGHCNNNPAGCTDSRGLGFTGGEDVFVGGVDALRGNPLPGQLGSEYLDYFNLLSCVSCGGGCEKPIVAFDTGVFGYCEWLSKYADKRMRSGRTVKFHEQEHLINDWQMIQSIDEKLHGIGDESCVTAECCQAKMKYYDLFQLYKKAETSVSQLQLEWDDYFDKARIEYNVAKRLSDAKGALEKAKTAMNSADKTMEEKCSK